MSLRTLLYTACWLMALGAVRSATAQADEAPRKPLVVSTATMFADMVTAIADTLVESVSIVPVGGDPHIYEPTPGDVRLVVRADLVLQNGLTFEGWLRELIANSGTRAATVTLTDGIVPIVSAKHQNAVDPHAWMDPAQGKIYARNIADALLRLLPDARDQIRERHRQYAAKLDSLDRYISRRIGEIPENGRILITSHDAFQYYGRRYGLRLESVLGTSTDADVRTADLMRLNDVIRESRVPVVFIESTINPKLLEQVASDNGIRIGGKLYSDSLGEPDGPAGTYIGMLTYNTDVIADGLTSARADESDTASGNPADGQPWIWLIGLIAILIGAWVFRKRMFPR